MKEVIYMCIAAFVVLSFMTMNTSNDETSITVCIPHEEGCFVVCHEKECFVLCYNREGSEEPYEYIHINV